MLRASKLWLAVRGGLSENVPQTLEEMTQAEQDAEIAYRASERLGLTVGDGEATIQQEVAALKEAEEAVVKIISETR